MDRSSYGGDQSHVAQQSRRDKLRIHQFSDSSEQFSVYPSLVHHQVRTNVVKNNAGFVIDPTSGMLNFATNSAVLSRHERSDRDHAMADDDDDEDGSDDDDDDDQELGNPIESSCFTNMSHPMLSNFNSLPKTSSGNDPQGGGGRWRNIETSPQNYDWMMNYASGSVGGGESHQKSMFVVGGEVLSNGNNARVSSSNIGFQDFQVQSSLANNPLSELSDHQERQKQFIRETQFASHHPIYYSTIQDVNSGSFGGNGRINLLPSYVNQPQIEGANAWIGRSVESWRGDPSCTQGLSLSLSSNPPCKVNVIEFGEGYESEYLQSRFARSSDPCPIEKPAIISKRSGKSLSEMVGNATTSVVRNTGPLGPFTGYAIILKSSRFLKPAQELLDELCNAKLMRTCEEVSERICRGGEEASGVSSLADASANNNVPTNNSGVSSSIHSPNEGGSGDGRGGTGSCEFYRSEYQQKKATLLYLQEEVCKRYKQYHQQMQMVASSFESVTGLSAATPYVSLALKTVSRNFRFLRNAISDQLKHATRVLGEDLLSSNTIGSSRRGDTSTSRLSRQMDLSIQKHKFGGANAGYFEPQQHVWRPQRGLPERSVAILRAWLFDHFLHPYPTDTDKHMLATQTGLSRNQVSNWFINARVRVWKPMVEEIHMLETKGLIESDHTCGKNDLNSAEGTSQPTGSGEQQQQQQQQRDERWHQEKKLTSDGYGFPTSMDGSLMNYLPYQRNAIDVGGLGAVSLTLGLRHGVENAQQLQQHEDQLRRQFSGHQMIHDFVG